MQLPTNDSRVRLNTFDLLNISRDGCCVSCAAASVTQCFGEIVLGVSSVNLMLSTIFCSSTGVHFGLLYGMAISEHCGCYTDGNRVLLFLETLIHPHRLNSIHLLGCYSQPVVSKRRKGRNASQVWVQFLSGRWAWAWRRHPWHPACQRHYRKIVSIHSAFPMRCGRRTGRWTGQQQTWRRSWPSQPS